ncbi:hypothetical protein HDN1F_09120 [gamma proteobacterium HdN1]|nr:hypothetical protein HDN1F_09120 [gamma proteobacterium HdN1]
MKKLLVSGAFMLASATASAAGFNYTYVEGGYGEVDNGDAFFVAGSAQLQRGLSVIGSYHRVDFDGPFDGDIYTVGAQINTPVGPATDFFASASAVRMEVDTTRRVLWYREKVTARDTGLLVRAGLRHQLQSNLHLEGDVSYNTNDFWDENELGIRGAVRYFFAPQVSAAVGFASDQELDGIFVSGRFEL